MFKAFLEHLTRLNAHHGYKRFGDYELSL